MNLPPLKIILKTKNEDFLLGAWLTYYINLVGEDNIIIYDDSSDSRYVLELYAKYKKIDIRTIPKNFKHIDSLHSYRPLHDEMQKTCLYYSILDTDEFLCFFDYARNTIDNSKLLNFIEKNAHRDAFPTTWIFNIYNGVDFLSIADVKEFNLQLTGVNVELGKIIASSRGAAGVNIGHNHCAGTQTVGKVKMQSCPELLLLHINHANWEHRIKSRLNLAKSFGAKFKNVDELIVQIKNKTKKMYYDIDILNYYTDRENFLNSKVTKKIEKHPTLITDILGNCDSKKQNNLCELKHVDFNLYDKINTLFAKSFDKPSRFAFVKT